LITNNYIIYGKNIIYIYGRKVLPKYLAKYRSENNFVKPSK